LKLIEDTPGYAVRIVRQPEVEDRVRRVESLSTRGEVATGSGQEKPKQKGGFAPVKSEHFRAYSKISRFFGITLILYYRVDSSNFSQKAHSKQKPPKMRCHPALMGNPGVQTKTPNFPRSHPSRRSHIPRMIIGVPKEIKAQEHRVALLPSAAYLLTKRGHQVLVEKSAGVGSGYPDEEYVNAGRGIGREARRSLRARPTSS